jgi:hypothetical protein
MQEKFGCKRPVILNFSDGATHALEPDGLAPEKVRKEHFETDKEKQKPPKPSYAIVSRRRRCFRQ